MLRTPLNTSIIIKNPLNVDSKILTLKTLESSWIWHVNFSKSKVTNCTALIVNADFSNTHLWLLVCVKSLFVSTLVTWKEVDQFLMMPAYTVAIFQWLYCLARQNILIYICCISPNSVWKSVIIQNSACFLEFITTESNIFMINGRKYASKMFLFAFIDIIC